MKKKALWKASLGLVGLGPTRYHSIVNVHECHVPRVHDSLGLYCTHSRERSTGKDLAGIWKIASASADVRENIYLLNTANLLLWYIGRLDPVTPNPIVPSQNADNTLIFLHTTHEISSSF